MARRWSHTCWASPACKTLAACINGCPEAKQRQDERQSEEVGHASR
jgi:hypothetical protein